MEMIKVPTPTLIEAPVTTFVIGVGSLPLHHAGLGNPFEIADNAEKCKEFLEKFESSTTEQCFELGQRFAQWLIPAVKRFSLSREGCRVVQKVMETAGAHNRDILAKQLEPHISELIASPHGNHVVAKMVEIMPPAAVRCVIEATIKWNPAELARHRYGCRILERLIEHCSEKQMSEVLDALVVQAEPLCRHPYGNFVVSHLLEHGSSVRKVSILDQLLQTLPQLAVHRTASHVVQNLIYHSDEVGKRRLVETLLREQSPHSIVDIACTRYGSFVVEDLANNVRGEKEALRPYLENGVDRLKESQFGKKVLDCFGLVTDTHANSA